MVNFFIKQRNRSEREHFSNMNIMLPDVKVHLRSVFEENVALRAVKGLHNFDNGPNGVAYTGESQHRNVGYTSESQKKQSDSFPVDAYCASVTFLQITP